MQAALRIGRRRRQNFEFRQSTEGNDALIGPTERDSRIRAGAQSVEWMQDLVGLSNRPSRAAGGYDFHRALEFHNADFISGLVAVCGLRVAMATPNRSNPPNCNQQALPGSFRKCAQTVPQD
jgi:hypothetical protein